MPPCHGGGRGFESRPDRSKEEAQVSNLLTWASSFALNLPLFPFNQASGNLVANFIPR